jgi:hypothetical protein
MKTAPSAPKPRSLTLLQASQEAPILARLTELVRDSAARLAAIQSLIPVALRTGIKPGSIDGEVWCLILDNNATAAKIRQLLPAFESHLRSKGWQITSIRLKVQSNQSR